MVTEWGGWMPADWVKVEQRVQPRSQARSKLRIVLGPRERLGPSRLGVMGRRQ